MKHGPLVAAVLLGVSAWAPSCAQNVEREPRGERTDRGRHAPRPDGPAERAAASAPAAPAGVLADRVRYRFAMADGAASRSRETLSLRDGFGHEVRLTRAYVVTHSISLAPCRPRVPGVPGVPGVQGASGQTGARFVSPAARLAALFLPSVARAGHGAPDPSATPVPRIESWLDATPAWVERSFPAADYCRVHHVLGRADDRTVGVTPSVSMQRTTLDLLGEVVGPGRTRRPFALRTALAHGRLDELPDALRGAPPGGRPRALEVTLTRRLDALFEGLDATSEDESALARAVLTAFVRDATVEVRDAAASAPAP